MYEIDEARMYLEHTTGNKKIQVDEEFESTFNFLLNI